MIWPERELPRRNHREIIHCSFISVILKYLLFPLSSPGSHSNKGQCVFETLTQPAGTAQCTFSVPRLLHYSIFDVSYSFNSIWNLKDVSALVTNPGSSFSLQHPPFPPALSDPFYCVLTDLPCGSDVTHLDGYSSVDSELYNHFLIPEPLTCVYVCNSLVSHVISYADMPADCAEHVVGTINGSLVGQASRSCAHLVSFYQLGYLLIDSVI